MSEKFQDTNSQVSEALASSTSSDHAVQTKYADLAVAFMHTHDAQTVEITPEQDKKLSRKLLWRVLGLTFLINMIMYMDKASLSYTSITGFWEATGLDQNKYNNVNTVFYVGFAVGQLPGTYLIQKLPISKLIFAITFLWSMVIFLHCAAYNYAGVIVLRFFLGFLESVAIPIMMTTNGMFLSQHIRELTQPIFYASCMASPIPIGFINYGVLHANSSIGDWRVLNIIIGGITFFLAIFVYFVYPNNPLDAGFLTTEEKVWVVRKIQGTSHQAIEQKHFKKHHAAEALKDPISWLICGFFLLQQLANNLPYQQTILYEEMGGLSNLDSTLVTVASSGFAVVWSVVAAIFLYYFPKTTCFTIIWSTLPSLAGSIAAVSLPLSNATGVLAAICLAANSFGVGWICAFGLGQTTAGASYTKRLVRNAMIMASYSVANIISPQLWRAKDAPNYVPAWVVQIVLSFSVAPALIGVVWFILNRRNKERLAALEKSQNVGYVKNDEGQLLEVNIAALDLTDLEDKTFIYPT